MKTAIVTGASSGIGLATTERLIQEGYHVGGLARRVNKLESLAKKWSDRLMVIPCDVTNRDQVVNTIDQIQKKWHRIDVLVNNAGVGHLGPISDAIFEDWERMVNVNVTGLLSCLHASLPALLDSKGHIINIASVAAHDVFPGSVVYCATKHAVNAITRGFRMEFRDKVKITNISPGAVNTEFKDHTHHPEFKKQFDTYFEGKVIEADDIANAIIYILNQPGHLAVNEYIIRPNR